MDQNSSQLNTRTWYWGLDEEHSLGAARHETDPARLATMAGEIISGKVKDAGFLTSELLLNQRLPLSQAFAVATFWRDCKGVHDFSWQLSMRKEAPLDMLRWCSESHDELTLETVALHPNTSMELLHSMARSDYWLAVRAACSSGRLPPEIMAEIAGHVDDMIRVAAAEFTKDPTICRQLASDPSAEIRIAAIRNTHTEISVINKAAVHETDQEVLAAVASRLTDPELLWKLADRIVLPSPLGDAILNNPNSPDEAKVVATLSI